jgi:hypothetical protein
MNDTTRQVGGAIGVALLGSIVSSHFASSMHSRLQGAVPTSVLHRAEDSVGAALGVAQSGAGSAAKIVDVAHSSFVSGMHLALLVALAIMVVGVIGVLAWLPAHAPDDGVEHASAADAVPAGVTGVDVFVAEPLADVVEELEYEHEHR